LINLDFRLRGKFVGFGIVETTLPSGETISDFTVASAGLVPRIQQFRLNLNFRWTFGRVLLLLHTKMPSGAMGQRRGCHEPDVAVDARALVKPALELRRVHLHGDNILSAGIRHIRDVITETAVTLS